MPRVPAHQVTTRNLGAAYPFIAEAGLGQRGVMIGDDLLGGSFVFDPFELYAMGAVSNPKLFVHRGPMKQRDVRPRERSAAPRRALCPALSRLWRPGAAAAGDTPRRGPGSLRRRYSERVFRSAPGKEHEKTDTDRSTRRRVAGSTLLPKKNPRRPARSRAVRR